jgi:radical SAM-linked protein
MKDCLSGASARTGTVETLIRAHADAPRRGSDLLTLVLELDIRDLARFLSHADLQRALKRCCVRAQLNLRYSQGFNPRPKMSLPLPKPVGMASCGDVLCVRLQQQGGDVPDDQTRSRMKQALSAQLPSGISVRALHVIPGKVTLYPRAFACTFSLRSSAAQRRVAAKIPDVMGRECLMIERTNPKKPNRIKHIDIRPYIASIELRPQELEMNCLIHDTGSIRVEEILMALGLDRADLDGPVQRDHLIWQLH